jgi:GntR family transcriptional regulator
MGIKFDNKIPIYMQIMDFIKQAIVTGKLKGGEKVPSVRILSEKLKVNPNTIQRAYQELEREGITFTQRGRGTFVTEDVKKIFELRKEMAKESLTQFIISMKQLGFGREEMLEMLSEMLNKEEIR